VVAAAISLSNTSHQPQEISLPAFAPGNNQSLPGYLNDNGSSSHAINLLRHVAAGCDTVVLKSEKAKTPSK
jgi:hypothetical protein